MSCAGSCRGTGDGKHPNSTGGMQGGLQWAQGCSKGLQQRADPPPPIAGRHCCSAQVSGGPAAQPQQLPTSTAGGEGVQRPNYTGKGDPAARPHVALCSVLRALCFVQCLHSVAQCSSSGCQCGAGGLQPCTVCAAAVCILGLSCSLWALPVGGGVNGVGSHCACCIFTVHFCVYEHYGLRALPCVRHCYRRGAQRWLLLLLTLFSNGFFSLITHFWGTCPVLKGAARRLQRPRRTRTAALCTRRYGAVLHGQSSAKKQSQRCVAAQ